LVGAATVTVALLEIVPPAPAQLKVNTVVALIAPVDCEPLVATGPLQAPDAVQVVALVEDQVKLEVPPWLTLLGLAAIKTVGCGVDTVIVADCAAEPPAPVQVSVNFVVAVRAGEVWLPAVACAPLQPPEAVQEVAFVDDHVNADVAPLCTVVGFALKVTDGAAVVTDTFADCTALPPVPLQVSVYVSLAVSAPVDCEPPLADFAPDHAPEAVQEVALVTDQLNVELLPLATVLGLAARVTVGAAAVTDTVADWAALPPLPVQLSE
jgi:hypothetical protein